MQVSRIFIIVVLSSILTLFKSYSQSSFQIDHTRSKTLDSIYYYLIQSTSWETNKCPKSDFVEEKTWSKNFALSTWNTYSPYKIKYIKNQNEAERYNVCLDTINYTIYFPFEDDGGPGKASGSEESFTIYLNNIDDYDWGNSDRGFYLYLSSSFPSYKIIAECTESNNCYLFNYQFRYLRVNFDFKDKGGKIKSHLTKLLKRVIVKRS